MPDAPTLAFLDSEVDTASVLFPVAITRGVQRRFLDLWLAIRGDEWRYERLRRGGIVRAFGLGGIVGHGYKAPKG